jgi:hypothetical protein
MNPIERHPVVDEFFDGLDERIGKRPCPICGESEWVSVPIPGYILAIPENLGEDPASLKVACLVCMHCYFLRPHIMDTGWHEAIKALRSPGAIDASIPGSD